MYHYRKNQKNQLFKKTKEYMQLYLIRSRIMQELGYWHSIKLKKIYLIHLHDKLCYRNKENRLKFSIKLE